MKTLGFLLLAIVSFLPAAVVGLALLVPVTFHRFSTIGKAAQMWSALSIALTGRIYYRLSTLPGPGLSQVI